MADKRNAEHDPDEHNNEQRGVKEVIHVGKARAGCTLKSIQAELLSILS